MPFAQIEVLLGASLPPVARADESFWRKRQEAQGLAWGQADRRVDWVDLEAELVAFGPAFTDLDAELAYERSNEYAKAGGSPSNKLTGRIDDRIARSHPHEPPRLARVHINVTVSWSESVALAVDDDGKVAQPKIRNGSGVLRIDFYEESNHRVLIEDAEDVNHRLTQLVTKSPRKADHEVRTEVIRTLQTGGEVFVAWSVDENIVTRSNFLFGILSAEADKVNAIAREACILSVPAPQRFR